MEIDNNLIENLIRPSALGKKNWLFIGDPEAGERSAVIYTLLGSCRRHGLNPFEYLKDLFTRLPAAEITEIKQFKPSQWTKAQAAQLAQTAWICHDTGNGSTAEGVHQVVNVACP